jgi:hypothetical protein
MRPTNERVRLDRNRVGATRNRRSGERGSAILEFAFLLPLLVVLVLGMADLSLLLGKKIDLTHISRESASILSRGGTFQQTFDAIDTADPGLSGPGGRIIITSVVVDPDGAPLIVRQERRGGLSLSSRIGYLPGGEASVPATIPNGVILPPGATVSFVEVFTSRSLFARDLIPGWGGALVLGSLGAF